MSYCEKLKLIFEEGTKRTEMPIIPWLNDIISFIKNSPYVIIYGAGHKGSFMRKFISLVCKDTAIYFTDADSSKWGTVYENCEVIAPMELVGRFGKNVPVIIAIWAYYQEKELQNKIDEYLKDFGCDNILPWEPHFLYWAENLRFAIPKFNYFTNEQLNRREKAFTVLEQLEDDFSKTAYCEYFRSFLCRVNYDAPEIHENYSYFSSDIFDFSANERVVDCGAYIGDTLAHFLRFFEECGFEYYDAFEPSPNIYLKLEEYIAGLPSNIRSKITAHAAGTSVTAGTASFVNEDSSSYITLSNEGIPIDLCTLDDVVYNRKPTLIKMDIEGAEMDTLLGSRRIIKDHRPILAVCIYHKPEDLIDIPLWITEQVPEYHLFVRKYYSNAAPLCEFVLYAIPPERMKNKKN